MSLEAVHDDGTTEVVFTVCANLVPVVAGNTVPGTARRDTAAVLDRRADRCTGAGAPAIERAGPTAAAAYRLPPDDTGATAVLGRRGPTAAVARGAPRALDDAADLRPAAWEWRRTRVGVVSAAAADAVFTLEDGVWGGSRATGAAGGAAPRLPHGRRASPRASATACSAPSPPAGTVFRATYRLGGGATRTSPPALCDGSALADVPVTNPVPATGGRDPSGRRDPPAWRAGAWRAVTYRAVRPEDYAEAVSGWHGCSAPAPRCAGPAAG